MKWIFRGCNLKKKIIKLLLFFLNIIAGLHESVSLSMMLLGHTKFTPDWHFGVWKIKWRQSDAECMEDIAYTVKASSRSGHNIPQRVNDPSRPVVFLNWKTFLENYFKLLKNITKYYHFRCTADEPGVLICREFCDSEEVRFNLLKARPEAGCLPTVKFIPPLDHLRQWYLYEKIAPFFINEVARDIVCPKPSISK